jgi:hypothetical protein
VAVQSSKKLRSNRSRGVSKEKNTDEKMMRIKNDTKGTIRKKRFLPAGRIEPPSPEPQSGVLPLYYAGILMEEEGVFGYINYFIPQN